jgi:DNA-directed RNA polymerase sigma subunit (sigma70/sigma32)
MRALYEQDRTIRIPVSKEEKIRKAQKFIDSQDQKPSVEEIAEHIGLSPSEAERTLQMSETIFSLDTPLENGTPQGNFIPDSKTKTPEEILIQQEKTQEIHTIIQERLSETRKKVICFHYGIGHGIILSNKGKAQVLRKKETQIMGILATSKKVLASAFWRYNKRESL